MQTMDATVRLQALDGAWETCGADRAIQVIPESIVAMANEWGPEKASFVLHRSPFALWPDLGAFTPVEIEIGGVVVWKGRVKETPTKTLDSSISVQCEGWQYHLDDDTYRRVYIHSKLTDWKDARSPLTANLSVMVSAGQVQVGSGAIVLAFPKGQPIAASVGVGVTLDLGEAAAKHIVAKCTTSNNTASMATFIIGHDDPDWTRDTLGSTRLDFVSNEPINKAAEQSFNATVESAKRYVTVLLWNGAEGAPEADVTVKFTSISIFRDTAYESGGASVLKASTVVRDALEQATMLLSSDYSQIDPAKEDDFAIPDLDPGKHMTPREMIEAVNAYHNWVTKLDPMERMIFTPRPTAPPLEIGAWSGADIEDASANDGEEIYNRAVVEAAGADGSQLSVEREAYQQAGVLSLAVTSPAAINPAFTTNTEGWEPVGEYTLVRDTAVSHSGPASGKIKASPKIGLVVGRFTGTFIAGRRYSLQLWLRAEATLSLEITFGASSDGNYVVSTIEGGSAWTPIILTWTPKHSTDEVTATLRRFSGGETFWVDDLAVLLAQPTIVDRRSFRRARVIQVNSAITPVEGERLGDIFLQGHMTTPFKGGTKILPGGIRMVRGGQDVHPSRLLLHTQELVRLSHMIDPDTGAIGRDGMIASVTYTHADKSAQVSLDENRSNFDALLNRLAVVQGVGS